jgi:hypothetical protein
MCRPYCGGWDASTTYTQEATVQFGSSPSRLPGASLNGRCTRCAPYLLSTNSFSGAEDVGTSSNHFCNTPSVEGVGTSTLDERTTQERLKIDLTLETRHVSIQTLSSFILFNKLLVTQYTTINFGPSTQVNTL